MNSCLLSSTRLSLFTPNATCVYATVRLYLRRHVPGVHRGSSDSRVHVRRPHEDKVVALCGANASRARPAVCRGNALAARSGHARSACQEHYQTGHHQLHTQLPQGQSLLYILCLFVIYLLRTTNCPSVIYFITVYI